MRAPHTRQQQRAVTAHRLVEDRRPKRQDPNESQGPTEAQDRAKAAFAKYKTFCMKGPTLLQQSGVMQTVAFCLSRDDDAARGWIYDLQTLIGQANLARYAREAALPEYLALSRDAIDAAVWLRRFAMSPPEGEATTRPQADTE